MSELQDEALTVKILPAVNEVVRSPFSLPPSLSVSFSLPSPCLKYSQLTLAPSSRFLPSSRPPSLKLRPPNT
jgi:hypothetical protein